MLAMHFVLQIVFFLHFSYIFESVILCSRYCNSLHDLYLATSSPGFDWRWKNETTSGAVWHFTNSCCTTNPCNEVEMWQGLTCRNSSIVAIRISEYNLNGTIPSSVFEGLMDVEVLDFSTNFLRGTVPEEISLLTQLQLLEISDNRLTGYIPLSITTMTKISALLMGFNDFQGPLPSGIGNMAHLNNLDFNSNALSGEPIILLFRLIFYITFNSFCSLKM